MFKNLVAIFLLTLLSFIMFRVVFPSKLIYPNKTTALCDFTDTKKWTSVIGDPTSKSVGTQYDEARDFFHIFFSYPPGTIMFACKTFVPISDLYDSETLNILVSIDQKADLQIGLQTKEGRGVNWTTKVDSTKTPTLLTFNLDRSDTPKINWLTADYAAIAFYVMNLDTNKPVNIYLYSVYLK